MAAIAEKKSCLFVLTATDMARLAQDDPTLSVAIHKIVSRSLALTLATVQDLHDPVYEATQN